MRHLPLIIPAVLFVALPAFGASSFLGGFSGSILTPDEVVVPAGQWDFSYHELTNLFDHRDLTAFGVTYGINENLEFGASFLHDGDSETALNAKYRLLRETPTRPMILVGAFDIGGTVDFLDDDAGLYIVLSKNVTPAATQIVGEASKPLRLNVGFGSGVFDGIFAGLDWTLQPQLSVMVEFFGGEIVKKDDFFNAGIRYSVTDALRLDAATIDFEDFAFGANYRVTLPL